MSYDKDLIAGKLRRWDKYILSYRLPSWEEIPDIGLYMEQVILLLKQYLDYLPPELKEEQYITASAINNYVRNKVMPEPVKKRYYRIHMAYLIIIFTLKQSISVSMVSQVIPMGIDAEEVKKIYVNFADRQAVSSRYLRDQMRLAYGQILGHDSGFSELSAPETEDLVVSSAIISGLLRVVTEKILLLNGCDLSNGGPIEPIERNSCGKEKEHDESKN